MVPVFDVESRFDLAEETMVQVSSWKEWQAQIAPQYIEAEVEEHDGDVRVDAVQLLQIGELLGGGYQSHVTDRNDEKKR